MYYYIMIINSDQDVLYEHDGPYLEIEQVLDIARAELAKGNAVDIHPENHCEERGCDG